MSLPLPEPLDIPDPNIDEPPLPATEPLDDPAPVPDTPGTGPAVGDPPSQAPAEHVLAVLQQGRFCNK
jgi:hypothetical protein